jgi:hypothetical protein
MKTFAAVLCAILATGGIAFAHGTAGGGAVMSGGPVMTPVGGPVITPVTAGFPVIAPIAPARTITTDRRRLHWRTTAISYANSQCRPLAYLLLPLWVLENQNATPYWSCGAAFVPTPGGLGQDWLMPAFMW